MRAVTKPDQVKLAQQVRETLAVYKEAEDLINIGAYKPGSNPRIDKAVKLIEPVNEFLKQDVEDRCDYGQTLRKLAAIFKGQ